VGGAARPDALAVPRGEEPERDAGARVVTIAPAADTGDARRFSFGNGVRLIYDPPAPAE
jgi:hypothetical protein